MGPIIILVTASIVLQDAVPALHGAYNYIGNSKYSTAGCSLMSCPRRIIVCNINSKPNYIPVGPVGRY